MFGAMFGSNESVAVVVLHMVYVSKVDNDFHQTMTNLINDLKMLFKNSVSQVLPARFYYYKKADRNYEFSDNFLDAEFHSQKVWSKILLIFRRLI